MTKNNVLLEQFLDEYKAFERAACSSARLSGLSWTCNATPSIDSIFALENYIEDQDIKDKIKTCRMIRNYAQHHPDAASFLAVSQEEISFLHELTREIICLNGVAKDIMVRCATPLTDKNTLSDFALAMISKNLSVYPYTRKDGTFSVLSDNDIIAALGSGATAKQKISTAVQTKNKIKTGFALQNTPIEQLPKADVVIILTQAKDKAIGVIENKNS